MKNRVREYRENFGWTQRELADLSAMHQATLSAIELGSIPGTPVQRVSLSRALGQSVAVLFPVEVLS